MKKALTLVSIVVVLVMLLTTAATAAPLKQEEKPAKGPGEPITIGFSFPQQENEFWMSIDAFLKKYAEEYGNRIGRKINLAITTAAADPSRQNADIEDLINRGVDIIMAAPQDSKSIGAAIKATHDAGLPFMTFVRASSPEVEKPDAWVGADTTDQAYTAGKALAAKIKADGATGKCIEIIGDLRDENAVNRTNGWKKAVDESGGVMTTIAQIPSEWDATKVRTGLTNAMTANPDANCLFVASDAFMAVIQAVLEPLGKWQPAGKPGHMYLSTVDIQPVAIPMIEQGYIDTDTEFPLWDAVVRAIELSNAMVTGEHSYNMVGRVVTPENVKTTENLWGRFGVKTQTQ